MAFEYQATTRKGCSFRTFIKKYTLNLSIKKKYIFIYKDIYVHMYREQKSITTSCIITKVRQTVSGIL